MLNASNDGYADSDGPLDISEEDQEAYLAFFRAWVRERSTELSDTELIGPHIDEAIRGDLLSRLDARADAGEAWAQHVRAAESKHDALAAVNEAVRIIAEDGRS
jgi:hypothetical protein